MRKRPLKVGTIVRIRQPKPILIGVIIRGNDTTHYCVAFDSPTRGKYYEFYTDEHLVRLRMSTKEELLTSSWVSLRRLGRTMHIK